MTTVLTTGDLSIPNQILDPWLGQIKTGSAIALLSDSIPMKFGVGESMTFDIGEAELVEEGQNKSPSNITSTVKTVRPHKFQKTVRWTDEVMWADADHQLGVVSQILSQIQPALSRALDFAVFHGINPADGVAAVSISESLSDTPNAVEFGTNDAFEYIDEIDEALLAEGYMPSDIAMDPRLASKFIVARYNGQKIYPDLRPTTAVSTLDGHRVSVSRTVGARGVMAGGSGIGAFVGDFSAIRWGVQKAIGLEVIQYGDPDGQGDLKRNNQVAFRAEVVYGFGIADLDAFAKLEMETGSSIGS